MVIGIDSSRAFVPDKTGTENYSYNLIKEIVRLPESRAHTFVLFTRPNTILPKELVGYTNVKIKQVMWSYLWTQVGLAWETWFNNKLDVLWVPAHTLPVLRNPRIPTVVTIHGLEYQWLPEYKNILQKWYLPLSTFYAAKYASKLIAVSQFTRNQLVKELHTSNKKIKVIHEGVESNKLTSQQTNVITESVLQKFGVESKKYILFVGTVQPRKNLVVLVEAFSQLRGDMSQIKLVIAGGIGWMAADVLQAPARYGVQEKVVFIGRVSDLELRSLYLGGLMYVQPSITEGFGLPILEAMGYGVPVICSDGGALPEVAQNAAIVVPLRENFVIKLAKAIVRLAQQPQLRATMIVAGKQRVANLTWQNAAKETLKILVTTGLDKF